MNPKHDSCRINDLPSANEMRTTPDIARPRRPDRPKALDFGVFLIPIERIPHPSSADAPSRSADFHPRLPGMTARRRRRRAANAVSAALWTENALKTAKIASEPHRRRFWISPSLAHPIRQIGLYDSLRRPIKRACKGPFIRIFYVWKPERWAARSRSKWQVRRKIELPADHRAA